MYFPEHVSRFKDWLKSLSGKKIVVLSHMRPDGDSIGSLVGLVRILRSLGIDVQAVNPDRVPRTLNFLLGDTEVIEEGAFSSDRDATILVDCADPFRIGKELSDSLPPFVGNIDHHVSNEGFAENDFILADAAATSEIIAGLAFDLGLEIDATAAQALYAGIVTDTGQFSYGNTSPRAFRLAEALCEKGADPSTVATQLYENDTFGRIQLLARFLSRLELHAEGRICVGYITEKDYVETGTSSEDAEGFSSYTRSIQGVELGVFLEDKAVGIKGSFRTRNQKVRADILAARFNGGGHASAAGFFVNDRPLKALIADILEAAGPIIDHE